MISYAKNRVEAKTWRTNSQKEEDRVIQEAWMASAVSGRREGGNGGEQEKGRDEFEPGEVSQEQ